MKKTISIALVLVLMLAVGFFVYITTPKLWPVYAEAQALIEDIEKFKKENHRLPSSIQEVAPKYWKENGPIYYEYKDDASYEVSFGIASVGESYVYDSKTKKWH